jgi:aldose 1-epimerase
VTAGPHGGPGEDVVVLVAGPARLEVAVLGATPLRWFVPFGDSLADVLDGYRDAEELRRQDGVRNGLMAPFCNRVADGRYVFDGVEHDLMPGSAERTIYHGLVRTQPFTLVRLDQVDGAAVAVLRCSALAGGDATGYPFRVVVEVEYRLGLATLDVQITGTNVGDHAAPFASGWHPYFRLPGTERVDRLHLTVPSTVAIATDSHLLPLPGERAFVPQDGARWLPIDDAVVDAAFGRLGTDGGGATTTLSDPATGVRLVVQQDRGLVHVFTGDTLARDRRASVAVEPVEVMTDAFNRPDCSDAVRLEPGQARTFRFRIAVTHEGIDA